MTKLVRITRTLKDKGIIVPEAEVASLIEPTSPYFQSLYYYGDEVIDYFKKNKNSIKGYKGRVSTPYIVFDIDSKDLEVSKRNTIILIDWLKEQGLYNEYAAKIAFSGSKGFHLILNTKYEFSPKDLKSLCMYISSQVPFVEEAGFQRVDPTIYNINRQFRIVNTINDKSGLYKIEMVESELRDCTMETIKSAAATPQRVYPFESEIDDKPIRAILLQLKDESKQKYDQPKANIIKTFIGANIPRKKCIEIIQDGDMKDGESNSGLLRLASFYRRQGYTREQCREKLVQAADNRAKKYPQTNEITDEKIDHEILSSVYSTEGYIFTCEDWFLKSKCRGACEQPRREFAKPNPAALDSACKLIASLHKKEPSDEFIETVEATDSPQVRVPEPAPTPTTDAPKRPVMSGFGATYKSNVVRQKGDAVKLSGFRTIKQSSDSFKSFADDWQSYRVITGIKDIDDVVRMLPTGLVIVNAKPGVGKTTIALNVMENCAKEGKHVLFYSIDMAEDEFFTKSKSKALRISPDEVLDLYFNKDTEALALQAEGDRLTEEMLKNIYINYESRITPEKIDSDLMAFKEAGINIDLVIIDYLQKMEGCGDFTSPRIGSTLMGLKSLQPKHKVCIIGLSQMPRGNGNEETPVLTASAAKGGGVYEENASVVINIWRPLKFYKNESGSQDKYLGVMIAKNRMGDCRQIVLKFNGAISEIRSLTPVEREDYEITVEERKQKEQPKVSRGFGHV